MALTWSRLFLAPIVFAAYRIGTETGSAVAVWIALVVLAVAAATDKLDGYIARKYDRVTDAGALLDPFTDSILFITMFLAFVADVIMPAWILLIILYRETFIHIILRPYLKKKGVTLHASIWGKLKTLTQSIVCIGIVPWRALTVSGDANLATLKTVGFWSLLLVAVLSVGSLSHYIYMARETLFSTEDRTSPDPEEAL
jgi:CDP-diacylglycerol--glycerol-3-phosphate 3-phosphatidyltransferase